MKHKTLVGIHIAATLIAILTIGVFFISSLIAELRGDLNLIKTVKRSILYALPILIIAMSTLAISGNKLAEGSGNLMVRKKKHRMKFVMINGMILISLAFFLDYRSHYKTADNAFLITQVFEFVFGLANLSLIGLNARTGLILSGRLRPKS